MHNFDLKVVQCNTKTIIIICGFKNSYDLRQWWIEGSSVQNYKNNLVLKKLSAKINVTVAYQCTKVFHLSKNNLIGNSILPKYFNIFFIHFTVNVISDM